MMIYIKCLEDENEQIKMEQNLLNTFNFPKTQPSHRRNEKEKDYLEDSAGWLDPYGFDEFGNFLAQIIKMDFTDGDLKEVFVDKNAQPLKKQISLSSDSQDKWLEEYEEEPLKYRTADMNDPEILKSFLRMLGIPYRPFDEVMAEIAQYIEKRKLNKTDPKQL